MSNTNCNHDPDAKMTDKAVETLFEETPDIQVAPTRTKLSFCGKSWRLDLRSRTKSRVKFDTFSQSTLRP